MSSSNSRFASPALLLACLIGTAISQEAKTPPTLDTLDPAVVSGVQERERPDHRRPPPGFHDVITVTRNRTVQVRVLPVSEQKELRFRRESGARVPVDTLRPPMQLQRDLLTTGGGPAKIREFTFELAANIDEADGLPAQIPFGPHLSLVNIDYVRLSDTHREAVTNLNNAVNPQTRRCEDQLGFADDGDDFANRYVLLGDTLKDCNLAVKSREGDLVFADGVPEGLRQDMRDLVTPIYNQFARTLGSEPAMTFVAWRPDSPRSDFTFERNWSRSSLLLLNGAAWQTGIDPQQRQGLWDALATEQIARRLGREGRPDAFTAAAVSYLLFIARSELDHATARRLAAELPNWIAKCEGSNGAGARQNSVSESVFNCDLMVQFVYDAVARAKSGGKETVNDTWRRLLTASFHRDEAGVDPRVFLVSSPDALRLVRGFMDVSTDWPGFIEELKVLGVQLRIKPGSDLPDVEVSSLAHFDG